MKSKNSSIGELLNNVANLVKYRTGIVKPPKRNKTAALAIVGATTGIALGILGGLLFAKESGRDARKKVSKAFKDATKRTSEYTTKEINRLNDLTKQQIEKLKSMKKEKVG
jgi:gas vesicle protein